MTKMARKMAVQAMASACHSFKPLARGARAGAVVAWAAACPLIFLSLKRILGGVYCFELTDSGLSNSGWGV